METGRSRLTALEGLRERPAKAWSAGARPSDDVAR